MTEFARAFIPNTTTGVRALHRAAADLRPARHRRGNHQALDRKVQLKSGGHLVIDQTESMTTIDVNTGAYVGSRTLEETIFRTNLEAAVAIARHLRLRNLGGIIIIDFIDMQDESHRRQVLAALERALAGDRAQTHIVSLSPLGLVEMTRKRTRESLEHLLCRPCPRLRRARLREDAGDGASRDLSRDCETKPAVREQGAADTGSSRCDRPVAG